MTGFLAFAGRHGKWSLLAGLMTGIALPELAGFFRALIPALVVVLLFLAMLRIDWGRTQMRRITVIGDAAALVFLQIVTPLIVIALLLAGGLTDGVWPILVLVTAAPAILGGTNMCLLMGLPGTLALRLTIAGTVVLPATAALVFQFTGQLLGEVTVIEAVVRLLVIIAIATVCGWLFRRAWQRAGRRLDNTVLDGMTAIALALFVIGLMEAIRPAIFNTPVYCLQMLALAFAINLGLQFITLGGLVVVGRGRAIPAEWPDLAVVSGNRNLALFLASLPASVMDPWLLFIGCYQVPMYATPLLMGWVYRRFGGGV